MTIREFKSKFDLREFAKDKLDTQMLGENVYIFCPFHSENTPSCLVKKDNFYCFGCKENGDCITFLTKSLDRSIQEILNDTELYKFFHSASIEQEDLCDSDRGVSNLSEDAVESFHENLVKNTAKHKFLSNRGITITTIKSARLGWGYPSGFSSYRAPRYTIPVYNKLGELASIRYRIDPDYSYTNEPKYIGHPNTGSHLYNSQIIANSDNLVIVGSELDAALLYFEYGVRAVAPPGENIFKPTWAKMFKNKNALLWLDSDLPGKTAMLHAYKKLKPYARNIKIYKWDLGLSNGYDVCDYIKEHGIDRFISDLIDYEMEYDS